MAKGRLAIIGSGVISGFHVAAARAVGFSVNHVAARPGSGSAKRFADEFGLAFSYDDPKELLDRSNEWDGLVLAASTDYMPTLLESACAIGKPILAEKPAARISSQLDSFEQFSDLIMIGYNRRFYSSVEYLKSFVESGGPTLVQCQLPEAMSELGSFEDRIAPVRLNSVHGFDLLRYVFGEVNLGQFVVSENRGAGVSVVFTTDRGHAGVIVANWNASANFSITSDRGNERVDLRPFEMATKFSGMEVVEPTVDSPIRRYTPQVAERHDVPSRDVNFKAGFISQYEAFASLMRGDRDPRGATIHDAQRALQIAEAFCAVVN